MNRPIACATLIIAATVANARTEIVDIENAPIPAALSSAQVENAIVTGMTTRGWVPKVIAPGHVEARLLIRSHMVAVDIEFRETTYSITYKDSDNLKYKNGKIHRNYNRWVANLNLDLQRSLLRAATQRPPTGESTQQ